MAIQQVSYRDWTQAYEVVSGPAKLTVVTEIGPRILSLTLNDGPNLLFDDVEGVFSFNDWNIYGGHRFWVAPETLLTFAPDNAPCMTRIEGETLVIEAPQDPVTGLQKTLRISPDEDGFRLVHTLKNSGPVLSPPCAVWALTCMRPTGVCAVPWLNGPEDWSVGNFQIWKQWSGHASTVGSSQWRFTPDLFEVHPTGEEGKVGFFAGDGWIGQWTDEATFVKAFPVTPGACYPDEGCNAELYTSPNFIELETLAPMGPIGPGEQVEHMERWFVVDPIERSSQAVAALIEG